MPQPYFMLGSGGSGTTVPFNGQILATTTSTNNNTGDSYYFLPFSDTQKIVIQWGGRPAQSGVLTTVTFRVTHSTSTLPVIFLTQWGLTNYGPQGRVDTRSTTQFTVDMQPGNNPKTAFVWLSIGLWTG